MCVRGGSRREEGGGGRRGEAVGRRRGKEEGGGSRGKEEGGCSRGKEEGEGEGGREEGGRRRGRCISSLLCIMLVFSYLNCADSIPRNLCSDSLYKIISNFASRIGGPHVTEISHTYLIKRWFLIQHIRMM